MTKKFPQANLRGQQNFKDLKLLILTSLSGQWSRREQIFSWKKVKTKESMMQKAETENKINGEACGSESEVML